MSTTIRADLSRAVWIHSYCQSASTFSLTDQNREKLAIASDSVPQNHNAEMIKIASSIFLAMFYGIITLR